MPSRLARCRLCPCETRPERASRGSGLGGGAINLGANSMLRRSHVLGWSTIAQQNMVPPPRSGRNAAWRTGCVKFVQCTLGPSLQHNMKTNKGQTSLHNLRNAGPTKLEVAPMLVATGANPGGCWPRPSTGRKQADDLGSKNRRRDAAIYSNLDSHNPHINVCGVDPCSSRHNDSATRLT